MIRAPRLRTGVAGRLLRTLGLIPVRAAERQRRALKERPVSERVVALRPFLTRFRLRRLLERRGQQGLTRLRRALRLGRRTRTVPKIRDSGKQALRRARRGTAFLSGRLLRGRRLPARDLHAAEILRFRRLTLEQERLLLTLILRLRRFLLARAEILRFSRGGSRARRTVEIRGKRGARRRQHNRASRQSARKKPSAAAAGRRRAYSTSSLAGNRFVDTGHLQSFELFAGKCPASSLTQRRRDWFGAYIGVLGLSAPAR